MQTVTEETVEELVTEEVTVSSSDTITSFVEPITDGFLILTPEEPSKWELLAYDPGSLGLIEERVIVPNCL